MWLVFWNGLFGATKGGRRSRPVGGESTSLTADVLRNAGDSCRPVGLGLVGWAIGATLGVMVST